jgi:hypothetical protein
LVQSLGKFFEFGHNTRLAAVGKLVRLEISEQDRWPGDLSASRSRPKDAPP